MNVKFSGVRINTDLLDGGGDSWFSGHAIGQFNTTASYFKYKYPDDVFEYGNTLRTGNNNQIDQEIVDFFQYNTAFPYDQIETYKE